MKRILSLILTTILIGLLVIPAAIALADQNFHTVHLPLSLTTDGEAAGYTLRNGWFTLTHTEGPINYIVVSFILNGAKPNTTYYVCWEFQGYEGYRFYDGHSIQTDKKGNGNIQIKESPDVVRSRVWPNTTVYYHPVLTVGGIADGEYFPGMYLMLGETAVYQTEVFEVNFDWD
jgi:hypothetical protein